MPLEVQRLGGLLENPMQIGTHTLQWESVLNGNNIVHLNKKLEIRLEVFLLCLTIYSLYWKNNYFYCKIMKGILYQDMDYVAGKEGWANTGNIDATFANFEAQSQWDTIHATVLSAMREEDYFNTTKLLVQAWEEIANGEISKAIKTIRDLQDLHIYLLDKNHSDLSDKEEMKTFIIKNFWKLLQKIETSDRSVIPSETNDYCISSWEQLFSLKGFGEKFCAEFYKKLCEIRGIDIDLVNLSSQSNNIAWGDSEEQTFVNALDFFRKHVWNRLVSWNHLILPWYIGGISWWIENAIGEWYSDATAALAAVTVKELVWEKKRVLLEILKSVPGIMSADPRLLKGSWETAQILRELDPLIAKEAVWVRWGQAKLLNSFTMLPAVLESWIDIRLRDPQLHNDLGTLISRNISPNQKWVQTVLWRTNVAMISISSTSMWQWFIAKISRVIKEYASVDIIGTSDTEYAFTVDMKSGTSWGKVEAMIKRLEDECLWKERDSIKTEFYNGLLFCIGHDMKVPGILEKAGAAMRKWKINVNLVSQWLEQRALVIWIDDESDVQRGVQLLHREFWLSGGNKVIRFCKWKLHEIYSIIQKPYEAG